MGVWEEHRLDLRFFLLLFFVLYFHILLIHTISTVFHESKSPFESRSQFFIRLFSSSSNSVVCCRHLLRSDDCFCFQEKKRLKQSKKKKIESAFSESRHFICATYRSSWTCGQGGVRGRGDVSICPSELTRANETGRLAGKEREMKRERFGSVDVTNTKGEKGDEQMRACARLRQIQTI